MGHIVGAALVSHHPGLMPVSYTHLDVYKRQVHDHQGSISAEHGLGVLRRDESARYKAPLELQLMRRIKQALDPQGLMNPGKVLKFE